MTLFTTAGLLMSEENPFVAFGGQHLLTLGIISVLSGLYMFLASRLDQQQKKIRWLFYMSLVPFFGTLVYYPMSALDGGLSWQEDLPLHLCRFLGLSCPIIVLKNSRFWVGIFYFWIMVGTLNANITPDLQFGMPHWNFFTYFITHGFLMVIPLYYVIVLGLKISWKDYFNAYWMMNLFLIITLTINLLLGSNYMYTRAKPPVESLLDLMGPWPIYLFTGQVLVLVLFYVVFAPFHISSVLKKNKH